MAPAALARVQAFVRDRGLTVGLELLVNFLLPFLIYSHYEKPLGEAHALMASSAPPIAWSLIEFARHRRVDAVSLLVLSGIGLSLAAYLGGGSVRLLQLREKLVTALVGCVFLGSAAVGRPLIYELARATIRRRNPAGLGEFEALKDNVHFRRVMMIMTLVWGAGLVAEAGLAAVLVLAVPVKKYLLLAPVLGYATFGALGLWSLLYSRQARRRGMARRAAALAEAEDAAQVSASTVG